MEKPWRKTPFEDAVTKLAKEGQSLGGKPGKVNAQALAPSRFSLLAERVKKKARRAMLG